MRKSLILVFLLSLVMAFAVACQGDTPAPPAPQDTGAPADVADPADNNNNDAEEPEEEEAGFEPIPHPAGMVYSMATDGWLQHLAQGERNYMTIFGGENRQAYAGTPYIVNAGNQHSFLIVEAPDGSNAIRVSGRGYSWNSIDLRGADHDTGEAVMDWDLANNTYLLTVTGNIEGDGDAHIGGSDSPWTTFVTAPTDADGNFEVSLVIDADIFEAAGERGWFRLNTTCTSPYTIYTITVARQ